MKVAVSGKGGVGKTTIVSLLARSFASDGYKVIVIDGDPDLNLAKTLGLPHYEKITSIGEMKELIEERTGKKGQIFFKLNPKVDDIPEKYFEEYKGIKLMQMGTIKEAGGGCVCPENTFLKALLEHLLIDRDEIVILDLPAGIEHLGRGTARGVNVFLIVVEPSRKSVDTAKRIKQLAEEIKIKSIYFVGNKIKDKNDKNFFKENFKKVEFIGFISYNDKILDDKNADVFEFNDVKVLKEIGLIKKNIERKKNEC